MSCCVRTEDDSALLSLLEALGQIPDPRKPRGIRYPQGAILALCIVAFMCGAQNLSQVRRFGLRQRKLLGLLGLMRATVPSVSGFSRIVGQVPLAQLQEALCRWLGAALSQRRCGRGVASVDGKAARSAGSHVLNVFLHDVEQVIWQAPVEEKKNEITVFKQSLGALIEHYPFVQLFIGDAMFAGAPLCSQLIGNGKDYLFQIKTDQKLLYEKLRVVFSPFLSRPVAPDAYSGEKKKRLCRGPRKPDR